MEKTKLETGRYVTPNGEHFEVVEHLQGFRVQRPLTLCKTPLESVATIAKDAALAVGIDIRGWRQLKRRFEHGGQSKFYDIEGAGAGERLTDLTAKSAKTMAYYRDLLRSMSDEEFSQNAQARTIPLVEALLPECRTAVSVGCAYARAEHIMARHFPKVRWHCLDFMPDLAEQNADLTLPNMSFHPGYPLDWIERAEPFDIALFNRVLCILSPDELDSYLTALQSKARYVVFGEQTKLHTFWFGVNLDRIDHHRRLRVHYIYNYRRIFADHGFEMIHYEGARSPVTREHPTQHYMILGVAQRADT